MKDRARRGVSLLELSIVVMVIGILCVTAYEYFRGEKEMVRAKVTEMKVRQIKEAYRQFYVETGHFPRTMGELRGKYLAQFPVRNAWGEIIEIEYGESPKIVYSTYHSGSRVKRRTDLFDPWDVDTQSGGSLQNIFDKRPGTAKIMIGKTAVKGRLITEETDGVDMMGRTVYNEFFGEYVYDCSIEIICRTPDDPDTTPVDPGHEIRVSFSGGELSAVTADNPQADLKFLGAEFTGSSSVLLTKYQLDLRACPFMTTFNLEIFSPGTPGLILYYGRHEIMRLPACDVYDSNPGGTDPIWLREFSPVSVERALHENTRSIH